MTLATGEGVVYLPLWRLVLISQGKYMRWQERWKVRDSNITLGQDTWKSLNPSNVTGLRCLDTLILIFFFLCSLDTCIPSSEGSNAVGALSWLFWSVRTLHRGWSFWSMLQVIKKRGEKKKELVHYSQNVFHCIKQSTASSVKVLLRMKATSSSTQLILWFSPSINPFLSVY